MNDNDYNDMGETMKSLDSGDGAMLFSLFAIFLSAFVFVASIFLWLVSTCHEVYFQMQ